MKIGSPTTAVERDEGDVAADEQEKGKDTADKMVTRDFFTQGRDFLDDQTKELILQIARGRTSETKASSIVLLTKQGISAKDATERGDTILDGAGELAHVPSIEGKEFHIDTQEAAEYIVPNPEQPREYFSIRELCKLCVTLFREGQETAVPVIPFWAKDASKMKYIIIDGERRLHAFTALNLFLQQHGFPTFPLRVVARWAKTRAEIRRRSAIINLNRQDHNAIEKAKIAEYLIEEEGALGTSNPKQIVAAALGFTRGTLENYLILLTLPKKLQHAVVTGKFKPSAGWALAQEARKLGVNLDDARIMSLILQNPDRKLKTKGKRGDTERTGRDVRIALQAALLERGDPVRAHRLQAKAAVYELLRGMSLLRTGLEKIMEADLSTLVDFLRIRIGEPPHLIDENLVALTELAGSVRPRIQLAMEPPALAVPEGKSSFSVFIQRLSPKAFGSPVRRRMAEKLAPASDLREGPDSVLDLERWSNEAGCSEYDITSNITPLRRELAVFDLQLVRLEIRKRDGRGHYEKYPAYRLNWKHNSAQPSDVHQLLARLIQRRGLEPVLPPRSIQPPRVAAALLPAGSSAAAAAAPPTRAIISPRTASPAQPNAAAPRPAVARTTATVAGETAVALAATAGPAAGRLIHAAPPPPPPPPALPPVLSDDERAELVKNPQIKTLELLTRLRGSSVWIKVTDRNMTEIKGSDATVPVSRVQPGVVVEFEVVSVAGRIGVKSKQNKGAKVISVPNDDKVIKLNIFVTKQEDTSMAAVHALSVSAGLRERRIEETRPAVSANAAALLEHLLKARASGPSHPAPVIRAQDVDIDEELADEPIRRGRSSDRARWLARKQRGQEERVAARVLAQQQASAAARAIYDAREITGNSKTVIQAAKTLFAYIENVTTKGDILRVRPGETAMKFDLNKKGERHFALRSNIADFPHAVQPYVSIFKKIIKREILKNEDDTGDIRLDMEVA